MQLQVSVVHLLTVYTSMWIENMVAARGWIAIALVVFAVWKPACLLLVLIFRDKTLFKMNSSASLAKTFLP